MVGSVGQGSAQRLQKAAAALVAFLSGLFSPLLTHVHSDLNKSHCAVKFVCIEQVFNLCALKFFWAIFVSTFFKF